MQRTRSLTTLLLASSIAGALSGCGGLIETAGKASGSVVGRQIADGAPAPPAATVVDPQGGNFCPVMKALGWPPKITTDRLNRPLQDATGNVLDHGAKYCGWTPPKP